MHDKPIVLTGASGFIAKHVLLKLLIGGHRVRATIRSPNRAAEVRAAVLPQLPPEAAQRLTFAHLDLLQDEGWAAALNGAGALVHTASPFPIAQPTDPNDLIRPAVDGTLRAMKAAQAAGVSRVILTSSVAAVYSIGGPAVQDESHWTDLQSPGVSAYIKSKTLAERAAWDFANANAMQLTTINPGLVMGPILDKVYGSSVGLVRRMLLGKDPMLPKISFALVDVRDVADMHVRALGNPQAVGERIIASAGSMWFCDVARVLKTVYPDRRIPTRNAPGIVLRALSLFDASVRTIAPRQGHFEQVTNAKAKRLLGIDFIPMDESIRASARSLFQMGQV